MSVGKVCLSTLGCALIGAATFAPIATSATGHRHRTSHHRHRASHQSHRASHFRQASVASDSVTCTGTQTKSVPNSLTVPAGATCTLAHTVKVGNNVIVDQGATLIDSGATIENSIIANQPKGIGIGGYGGQPGYVSTNITITGLTGAGPGTVHKGDNYICDTNVGNNVTVQSTASGAGQWIIGDRDEECTGGTDQVDGNLTASNNLNRVDVSDIEKGQPPYSVGIGNNLTVTGNLVNATSPVVESNFVGGNAACQAGTKMDSDGTPNVVDGTNKGCP